MPYFLATQSNLPYFCKKVKYPTFAKKVKYPTFCKKGQIPYFLQKSQIPYFCKKSNSLLLQKSQIPYFCKKVKYPTFAKKVKYPTFATGDFWCGAAVKCAPHVYLTVVDLQLRCIFICACNAIGAANRKLNSGE